MNRIILHGWNMNMNKRGYQKLLLLLCLTGINVYGSGKLAKRLISVGKTASQSSTYENSYNPISGKAVDGNTDGDWFHKSVSSTNKEKNAWWMVDLGTTYNIAEIKIFNRTDACMDRLNDYTIQILDTNRAKVWSSHQAVSPNPSLSVSVPQKKGRFVKIQLKGTEILHMAEVEVYAWLPPDIEIKDAGLLYQVKPCVINGDAKTVVLYGNLSTDATAIEPKFIIHKTASIKPKGPKDFSKGSVTYIVSNQGASAKWTVSYKRIDGNVDVIGNDELVVTIDKANPQAIYYALKGSNNMMAGNLDYLDDGFRIKINGTEYDPRVSYKKTSTHSAEYTLTIDNVDLDGRGGLPPRKVTLRYEFKIKGRNFIKKLIIVKGDEPNYRFMIEFNVPMLTVNDRMNTPGIAVSNGKIEYRKTLAELKDFKLGDIGYAIAWNDKVAGTIYRVHGFDRCYTAIKAGNEAKIYDGPYHYRFIGGERQQRETRLNTNVDVNYESIIGITDDQNKNAVVDWQDGALKLRDLLPDMPKDLRAFFNGGSWLQSHGAFPGQWGNDCNAALGFTVVFTEFADFIEIQRQTINMTDGIGKHAYGLVGWNGRGHDYGWPSISEVYFNPALGTDRDFKAAQKKIVPLGGILGVHLNMTDMTVNSNAYKRNAKEHPLGNRSSSTGTVQYGNKTFGWMAYKMNHYRDYRKGYAFNRQNEFVKRFFAPYILYQDVMLDYPAFGYTKFEERYAKKRVIDHWRMLGTYAATEYYYPEKVLSGQYMFKNNQAATILDDFVNSGNVAIHSTRNYAVRNRDYIFANIYSSLNVHGNVNKAMLYGTDRATSLILTRNSMLFSYLNGYLAKKGLKEYLETATHYISKWGNDTVFKIAKKGGSFRVTTGDFTIADGNDRFIPDVDGKPRIFVYSVSGNSKTWKLPKAWRKLKSLNVYELTTDGRNFISTVNVSNDNVTLHTKAETAYVLTPSNKAKVSVNNNLALLAKASASSNSSYAWSGTPKMFKGYEFRYIDKTNAPNGDWRTVLDGMKENVMIDSKGTLRYEASINAKQAADGVNSTWWSPVYDSSRGTIDMADGNAWLELDLGHPCSISKLKINEVGTKGHKVTSFQILYEKNGKWILIKSGTRIPSRNITFRPVTTQKIRLLINGAESNRPKIAEMEIYKK